MLYLTVSSGEIFDEATWTFTEIKPTVIQLEHSLLAISKWESKWKKPFMSTKQKTDEEFRDYVRCMTINRNVDPNVYYRLTAADYRKIDEYIHDPMTATVFHNAKKERPSSKQVTSEQIYFWMCQAQIPFEAEKWHLNRLMTLIRIYSIENNPKKMSKNDIYKSNKAINEANKAKYHSRG